MKISETEARKSVTNEVVALHSSEEYGMMADNINNFISPRICVLTWAAQ